MKHVMRSTPLMLMGCLCVCVFAGCGEGDFDQRIRSDIEEQRIEAFDDINTNPQDGFGKVIGALSTGGPLFDGRVVLLPVESDGTLLEAESDWLGNSVTQFGFAEFTATVQEAYQGPIIVSVRGVELNGVRTTYANPALAESQPFVDLNDSDELLGYVLDYPNATDAVVVSPLTTLVVERAIFLGGISSGNLAIAARQVAAFFGFFDVREAVGVDLTDEDLESGEDLALNLAQAAISQIARDANVTPAKVWKAMRLDIRDDGALNGSIGFIPGSGSVLPDLGAANVIGTALLREGYLAAGNAENYSQLSLSAATPGSAFAALLAFLDTARALDDTTLSIDDLSQEFFSLSLAPGESSHVGVRAFEAVGSVNYLVVSPDGPTVAQFDVMTSDASVCAVDANNQLTVPLSALSGQQATITVRIRPDGTTLVGSFDESVTLQVFVN